ARPSGVRSRLSPPADPAWAARPARRAPVPGGVTGSHGLSVPPARPAARPTGCPPVRGAVPPRASGRPGLGGASGPPGVCPGGVTGSHGLSVPPSRPAARPVRGAVPPVRGAVPPLASGRPGLGGPSGPPGACPGGVTGFHGLSVPPARPAARPVRGAVPPVRGAVLPVRGAVPPLAPGPRVPAGRWSPSGASAAQVLPDPPTRPPPDASGPPFRACPVP